MPEENLLKQIGQSGLTCSPNSFWRAASQRLATAIVLLECQRHLDAVYLAGYVVECAMKALILERTPPSKRRAACQELTSGAKCHNFDYLSQASLLKGFPVPREIRNHLDILNDEWSTDLRYVGTLISYREAERFIRRVQSTYLWVERCL